MPVEFRLRRAKGQGLKAQFSAASLALQVYKKQQEIAKLDSMAQQALEQADSPRRTP